MRFWRKNRRPNAKNPRCPGVDLNRNFDANFGGVGTSGRPCAETYRGPSAMSEKESSSLNKFVGSFKNIKLYLAFHSYSQLLMFPYVSNLSGYFLLVLIILLILTLKGHTNKPAPNFDDLVSLVINIYGVFNDNNSCTIFGNRTV